MTLMLLVMIMYDNDDYNNEAIYNSYNNYLFKLHFMNMLLKSANVNLTIRVVCN